MDRHHVCPMCGKKFTRRDSLQRHIRGTHEGRRDHQCERCGKRFFRKADLYRHIFTCKVNGPRDRSVVRMRDELANSSRQLGLDDSRRDTAGIEERPRTNAFAPAVNRAGGKGYIAGSYRGKAPFIKKGRAASTGASSPAISPTISPPPRGSQLPEDGSSHVRSSPSPPPLSPVPSTSGVKTSKPKTPRPRPSNYKCRFEQCGREFENRGDLIRHRLDEHIVPRLLKQNWDSPYPWIDENNQIDEPLRQILNDSRGFIFQEHQHKTITSHYNFPLRHERLSADLQEAFNAVRRARPEALKIDACLGMVLRNRETGQYRYFVPGVNVSLLQVPRRLERPREWDEFLAELDPVTLLEAASRDRGDTKWQLVLVTNVKIKVFYLGVEMGAGDVPDYIKKCHSIRSLDRDPHNHPFNDRLCAFRGVVVHRNLQAGRAWKYQLQTETMELARRWGSPVIHMDELEDFERMFGLRVDIYSMDESGAVYPRFLSRKNNGEHIVFNLHGDHLSLVVNSQAYLHKYMCVSCHRHFTRLSSLKGHRGRCARVTKLNFTHCHYQPRHTVFEKLAEVAIDVRASERCYPWHAEFDAESLLKRVRASPGNTVYINRHEPISVAVSSNVDGFRDSICFINPDGYELARNLVDYLHKISDKVYELARMRWGRVFRLLQDEPGDCENAEQRRELTTFISNPAFMARRTSLRNEFHSYCRFLPVLGFNSSKYDFHVLKTYLFKALEMTDSTVTDDPDGDDKNYGKTKPFVIKQQNKYSMVSASNLRFLDVANYIAPGFSYSQLLQAYGVEERKGYFPYEWFDHVDKLDAIALPPYEAFQSTLKNCNVLDDDQGEAGGRRRYAELCEIWRQKGMSSFRDYLSYYNRLDVGPFTRAVDKMLEFYFGLGIDLFNVAISVPGVARNLLYRTAARAGVSFSPVRPGDEDLYYLIKQSIVGGPSIIFTREHEVGRTFTGDDPALTVGSILGLDANGLYLWAIDQHMPSGDYIRRYGPEFTPEFPGTRRDMFHWLDFVSRIENIEIWHGRNHGEVRVGPYRVDGFAPGTNVVFEYDGCYWHGCADCGIRDTPEQRRRAQSTQNRRQWFLDNGYIVRVMRSHELKQLHRENLAYHAFVDERVPLFYRNHRGGISEAQILNGVRSGELFGMIEVDIDVPAHLRDTFKEMSPLFVNTDVPFDKIGHTMQEFVEEAGLSTKSRRLLVGGLSAERVLLSSDLLKWYLDHGLVVSKVHQVVEYTPNRCFREFVEKVTEARRAGDIDAALKIIADTFKLIGNSAYGSVIMNKEIHRDIRYFSNIWKAQLAINDPSFIDLCELDDDLFEVCKKKRKIDLDLPIQIGFQILQLAKLRMLQFYYDFLKTKFHPDRFEMIEMDTDSYYFAIGGVHRDNAGTTKPVAALRDIARDRARYDDLVISRCGEQKHSPDEGMFLPRDCCIRHRKYDARTPGLFKLEAEGVHMIGLCSKTYCLKKCDGSLKVATKGLRTNALHDPMVVFENVLASREAAGGDNVSFVARDNTVYTCRQTRRSISWFYCKRVVGLDGIHTRALDMVLCPWPQRDAEFVDNPCHVLWPWRRRRIIIDNVTYGSLAELCRGVWMRDDVDAVMERVGEQIDYRRASGLLVFVSNEFDIRQDRKIIMTMTAGVNGRCARLLPEEKFPGLNRLALAFPSD